MEKFVFILSPPFSGSTLVHQLVSTSNSVSEIPGEGLFISSVRKLLPRDLYAMKQEISWPAVREEGERVWEVDKPILLEKSPPTIVHAQDMAQHFQPAYFLCLVRDAYAYCEGHQRRRGLGYRFAAQRWVVQVQHQISNLENLNHSLKISYEDLVEDPAGTRDRIVEFLPELADIDIQAEFEVKSVDNAWKQKSAIRNLNPTKIALLSKEDITEINQVLDTHSDVLEYFGYQRIDPVIHTQSQSTPTSPAVKLVRGKYAVKRLLLRTFRRLGLEHFFPRKF